jgi:SAM-dependent methyltransferase
MEAGAYEEMAELQDHHWWFVARRRILAETIARLPLPAAPRILEIGAGTGGNLPMLGGFGHVQAVEMDEYARTLASDRVPAAKIQPGSLPDCIPCEAGSFDLVCLFDVLEHVERDQASLVALRQLVVPGGFALVTVPAYRWLWSRHDERLHHVRRYSAGELRTKALAAGWTVSRLTYFNTLLFPLAVVARIVDRLRSSAAPAGTGLPATALNAALLSVFGSERALLARTNLPFGVSILAVLRAK